MMTAGLHSGIHYNRSISDTTEKYSNIPVMTSARVCRTRPSRGVNVHNLKAVTPRRRWNIPVLLNVNARSLCTEKIDELQAVADNNSVTCVCVTETWFSDYVPTESVSLPGYSCERRDRSNKRGGGVACYIKESFQYDRINDLNHDTLETLWVRLTPHMLPRRFSCIVVGCVYHPPDADDATMRDYLITSLDNILRKYPEAGIILMGDFNRLRDNFIKSHYAYKQIVVSPTRNDAILDKIWTNMYMVYDSPVTLSALGASDHNMVLVLPCNQSSLQTGSLQQIVTRRMGLTEKIHFADQLSRVHWEPLYRFEYCADQFTFYQEVMDKLMNDCFPFRSVTRHSGDKPWVTDSFRQLVRRRQRARMSGDKCQANQLRNKVNREATRLRHQFYQSKILDLEDSSSKDWWKHMKALMGISSGGTKELVGLANRHTDGNIPALANKINDFLVSVSSGLTRLTQDHGVFDLQEPLPDAYTVTVANTQKALSEVKTRKATGPDQIPAWVLKDFSHVLAAPLAAIFNSSLREGVLPSLWKTATIVPLPKKHPPTSIEKDIRPISLTPIVSKVFEAIVLKWVDTVMRPQLDPRQFGSIPGTCTTDALVEMVHQWYQETDYTGKCVRILLIDYSKAFDLINHDILIAKLTSMGIPAHLVRWMAAFLVDRQHRVRIDDTLSELGFPNGGVPQGTLSGPKDFLAHINDLTTPCAIYKYVDDSTIFEVCNSTSISRIQESADIALQWSNLNDMKINTSKTHEMVIDFTNGTGFAKSLPNILMNGLEIQKTDHAKILGVTISSDLTWNRHVDNIVSKACKRLYMLYQLKRAGIAQTDLVRIYISVIRPILEYACPVWSTNIPLYLSDKIEMVQKRAMRAIYPGLSYADILNVVGIAPLSVRRTQICTRYFNDMKQEDHKLHHLLPEQRNVHYELRSCNQYPLVRCRTSRYKNSFIPWCLSNCQ